MNALRIVILLLQVYVWHTRTEAPKLQSEKDLNKKGLKSNAGMEV
jgi:hypothetical protein